MKNKETTSRICPKAQPTLSLKRHIAERIRECSLSREVQALLAGAESKEGKIEMYRFIVGDDGNDLLAVIDDFIRTNNLSPEEIDDEIKNLKAFIETGTVLE